MSFITASIRQGETLDGAHANLRDAAELLSQAGYELPNSSREHQAREIIVQWTGEEVRQASQ